MKLEELQSELKVALKERNKEYIIVIKDVIAEAKNKAIADKRKDVTEDDVTDALNKVRKVYQDQLDSCPKDRIDNMILYRLHYEMLSKFLPKQLTKEEVDAKVKELLDGSEATNIGEAMKVVMPELKGNAAPNVSKLNILF